MWDPSRQQASRTEDLFGDYNPFGAKPTAKVSMEHQSPTVHASTVIPLEAPQKQQQVTPSTSALTSDLQKRQEELERKAQELEKREQELNHASSNVQQKNWPPLPEKFCVQPCFYQDINVEISPEFQKTVRFLYYMWLSHALLYILNVGGCMALFIQMGEGTMFGLSILYCALFIPASYLFWFRPVYKAFKMDSSFNFMVFFVFFAAQLVATIIQSIGFPNLGTCGFIVALAALGSSHENSGNLAVAIIVLVIACGFAVVAFGDFFFLVRVSRLYRSSGGSFSKARSEFTSGVMRNEHVQNAATEVVTSAVRAQMNST